MDILAFLSNAVALFMLWLFLSAGASKLNPSNLGFYQEIVVGYGVKLPELAKVLVWLIGALEVTAAILVVLPMFRLLGSILCAILLAVYGLAIAAQLIQGKIDQDCGCAGPGQSVKVSPALLIRNTLYICLIATIWLTELSGASMGSGFAFSVFTLTSALMMILISASAENLIANAQKLAVLRRHLNQFRG